GGSGRTRGSRRERTSRSPSIRSRCTSSTRRQDLGSTSRRTRKEQRRETWLDEESRPGGGGYPARRPRGLEQRLGGDEARSGGEGDQHHLRRRGDGSGGGPFPGGAQRLPEVGV